MLDRIDLSGHWSGFYTQHDHRRPISAELSQDGDRLIGTMNDDCTVIERSVSELAMEEGLPPGADEKIVEQIRSMVPEVPSGPIRAETQLPPRSHLEGEVDGRAVRFLKTYQGPSFTGYRVGDFRVGMLGEGQEVRYRGLLNDDGTVIEGQWQIDAVLGLPRRVEGGFWLRRQAPDGAN